MSRIEKIREMLVEDPQDFFLRYSLAMELDKISEHEESLSLFLELIKCSPPHVPSFFMSGQQLSRLGRTEEARAILRDGIEEARSQNNKHAAGEMSEFLASLGSTV